jgi:hypothetical protein
MGRRKPQIRLESKLRLIFIDNNLASQIENNLERNCVLYGEPVKGKNVGVIYGLQAHAPHSNLTLEGFIFVPVVRGLEEATGYFETYGYPLIFSFTDNMKEMLRFKYSRSGESSAEHIGTNQSNTDVIKGLLGLHEWESLSPSHGKIRKYFQKRVREFEVKAPNNLPTEFHNY